MIQPGRREKYGLRRPVLSKLARRAVYAYLDTIHASELLLNRYRSVHAIANSEDEKIELFNRTVEQILGEVGKKLPGRKEPRLERARNRQAMRLQRDALKIVIGALSTGDSLENLESQLRVICFDNGFQSPTKQNMVWLKEELSKILKPLENRLISLDSRIDSHQS